MITARIASRPRSASTARQRSLRRHSCGQPLKKAVRFAVDTCFRFQCRAPQGKALWSETERVWLGNDTFMHWAICLEDIDIPWAVATASGAPTNANQLRVAVVTELKSYWADQVAELPRREDPRWMPLP